MVCSVLAQILSLLVDLLTGGRRSEQAKELEILVLRQQLRVLQRTQTQPPRPSRWEKLTLALLTAKFKEVAKGVRHPRCRRPSCAGIVISSAGSGRSRTATPAERKHLAQLSHPSEPADPCL